MDIHTETLNLIDMVASKDDPSHDKEHIIRVLRTARSIANAEGSYNPEVLDMACVLHDYQALDKSNPLSRYSSVISSIAARDLLMEKNFPEHLIPKVMHCIQSHSWSGRIVPMTAEAYALQDADRLDALGAVGIARCFAVSGKMGKKLFSSDDPLAENRALDDQVWALDHFSVKLLKLVDTMNTQHGKKIALNRAEYIKDFMDRVTAEISGTL